MNLQPLGDRLIVEVLDEESTTASGIVLPDTAQEKPQRGKVLSVGPGRECRVRGATAAVCRRTDLRLAGALPAA